MGFTWVLHNKILNIFQVIKIHTIFSLTIQKQIFNRVISQIFRFIKYFLVPNFQNFDFTPLFILLLL